MRKLKRKKLKGLKLHDPVRLDQVSQRIGFYDKDAKEDFLKCLSKEIFGSALGAPQGARKQPIVNSKAYFFFGKNVFGPSWEELEQNDVYVYLVFPGSYCTANLNEVWNLSKKVDKWLLAQGRAVSVKSFHVCANLLDVEPEDLIDVNSFRVSKTRMRKSIDMNEAGDVQTYTQRKGSKEWRLYSKPDEILNRLNKRRPLSEYDKAILRLRRKLSRFEVELKSKFADTANDIFHQEECVYDFSKRIMHSYLDNNEFKNDDRTLNIIWKALKKICKTKKQYFRTKTLRSNPNMERILNRYVAAGYKIAEQFQLSALEHLNLGLRAGGKVGPTDVIELELEKSESQGTPLETLNYLRTRVVQLSIENSELIAVVSKLQNEASKRAKRERGLLRRSAKKPKRNQRQ